MDFFVKCYDDKYNWFVGFLYFFVVYLVVFLFVIFFILWKCFFKVRKVISGKELDLLIRGF